MSTMVSQRRCLLFVLKLDWLLVAVLREFLQGIYMLAGSRPWFDCMLNLDA